MNPIDDGSEDRDGRLSGLMKAVDQQYPGLLRKMLPSASEAKRMNRELGILPPAGKTHLDIAPLKIPKEVQKAVEAMTRKLSKAIYYKETSRIFPNLGCLAMAWATNSDLVENGRYQLLDLLEHLPGRAPAMVRSGQALGDRFRYKISISESEGAMLLQSIFGNAFSAVVFGSAKPGILENAMARLSSKIGPSTSLVVIQSPNLAQD